MRINADDLVIAELRALARSRSLFVVLIGCPGAGKTHFAEKLLAHLPTAHHINTDNSADDRIIESRATHFKRVLLEALSTGQSIIIDQTNVSPTIREQRLKQAPGYVKIGVDLQCLGLDELYTRVKKRAEATGRYIPRRVIKQLLEEYRPPQYIEGFDYIFRVEKQDA